MVNRERVSLTVSSPRAGRWEISILPCSFPDGARHMTPKGWRGGDALWAPPPGPWPGMMPGAGSLRVELDDQLFLNRNVDLGALRQLVDQHAEVRRYDLQPRRDRTLAEGFLSRDEGQHRHRLRPNVDDVPLGDLERRDVDLLAVDQEVAVAHQLARLAARAGDAGAVDHVVQPRLEDLQQVLTGLARTPHGFLVVPDELALENAVRVTSLLLLLRLQEVLGLLDPAAAVLAGRIGAAPESLVAADEVNLEATRNTRRGAGVTSHFFLLLPVPQTRRRFGGRQPL